MKLASYFSLRGQKYSKFTSKRQKNGESTAFINISCNFVGKVNNYATSIPFHSKHP